MVSDCSSFTVPHGRGAYLSLLEVARVSQAWVVVWLLGGRGPATDPLHHPGMGADVDNTLGDVPLL
jgi:hypothetical protein